MWIEGSKVRVCRAARRGAEAAETAEREEVDSWRQARR